MRASFFRTTLYLVVFSFLFSISLNALAQDDGSGGSAVQPQPAPVIEPIQPVQPQPPQPAGEGGDMAPGVPAMPTCNINGVETPGPCPASGDGSGSNTMGQPNIGNFGPMTGPGGPGGGQMGPGGQGQGQGGPSEEDIQKMEARQKEMEKKNVEQMKKSAKQMIKPMADFEKRLVKLEAQHVPIPTEIKEQIAAFKSANEMLQTAEDMDTAQEQMDIMREAMQTAQEGRQKLEMLAQVPKALKSADKEIARLDKAYASYDKKLQKAKFDGTTIMGNFRHAIDELKNNSAKAKSGDLANEDDPMMWLQDNIFDMIPDTWQYQKTLDIVLNVKRNLKQVAAAIKKYEKIIAAKTKKGQDMTEAMVVFDEMKSTYGEVNNLVIDKMDPDEVETVMDDVNNYMDLQGQLEEILGLSGPNILEQQIKQGPPPGGYMPTFNQQIKSVDKLMKAQTDQKLAQLASLLKQVNSMTKDLAKSGVTLPANLQEIVNKSLSDLGYTLKLAIN